MKLNHKYKTKKNKKKKFKVNGGEKRTFSEFGEFSKFSGHCPLNLLNSLNSQNSLNIDILIHDWTKKNMFH